MKNGKSIFKKWWFWLIVIAVISGVYRNGGSGRSSTPARQTETTTQRAVSTTAPAESTTAAPAEAPAKSETKESKPLKETDIRPEVKEFLDSYEACMDEYVNFMKKYENADSDDSLSMLGDYYRILARYLEFEAAMEEFDEDELTTAELAYYTKVMGRVTQKLLSVG